MDLRSTLLSTLLLAVLLLRATEGQGRSGFPIWKHRERESDNNRFGLLSVGSLEYNQRGRWTHVCGATLIGPRHALTAAHCMEKQFESGHGQSNYRLTLGLKYLGGMKPQTRLVVTAKKMFDANIIVLMLESPVPISGHDIRAIALPEEYQIINPYTKCHVLSWGNIDPSGAYTDMSSIIRYGSVVPQKECKWKLDEPVKYAEMSKLRRAPRFICVGNIKKTLGCRGDGGSPLICPGKDGKPFLAGIATDDKFCADGPSIFTAVRTEIIEKIIKDD